MSEYKCIDEGCLHYDHPLMITYPDISLQSALAIEQAKVARVRERHYGLEPIVGDISFCAEDGFPFPCPTYQDTEEGE